MQRSRKIGLIIRKMQSIVTDPEIEQILELAEKAIKATAINIFHICRRKYEYVKEKDERYK